MARPAKTEAPAAKPKSWLSKIGDGLLSRLNKPGTAVSVDRINPFTPAKPAPGVLPSDREFAMDESIETNLKWAMDSYMEPGIAWAQQGLYNSIANQGYQFLGYAFLAELTQIPEYRRISEVLSTEMTRKWIKLQSASEDEGKADVLKKINEEMERLKVKDCFQRLALQDGFFGRAHLFIDIGTKLDDRKELLMPIGDGRDNMSQAKVKKGSLKRLQVVEAVWCYPSNYNSNNPLHPDWYNPATWFCMGTEMHSSRLLRFVSREVPDLLKPAYSFGGMSMSQMAKPYVDNWIRARQAVSDMIYRFSIVVLKTNMGDSLSVAGDEVINRAVMFAKFRDNRGLMMINNAPNTNEDESLTAVNVPLTTLDILQAQAQEHMAAVSGIPLVKLLGISPAGLNASSEGEIRTFYDTIHANQERLFTDPLRRILGFIQLSLFGKVDPDITFMWEPLWSMDAKALADIEKTKAETGQILIDGGVLDRSEERERVAQTPDSDYQGLEVEDLPELPEPEDDNSSDGGGGANED